MTRHGPPSRRYRRSSSPRAAVERLQEPLPTFTALLAAAQCVEMASSARVGANEMKIESLPTFTALLTAAQSVDMTTPSACVTPKASEATASSTSTSTATPTAVVRRRLRNRVSCRKTRLKRKLRQHALQSLAHTRDKRQQYLTQLAAKLHLGVDGAASACSEHSRHHYDALFRDLAARSLHYALVDDEYDGWKDCNGVSPSPTALSTSVATRTSVPALRNADTEREKEERDNAIPVSFDTALRSSSAQDSLLQQWRLLADGLQNVELELQQPEERALDAHVVEWHARWRLVGVRSVCVQRDGEITGVAISGATLVRFCGRRVDALELSVVRREDNAAFNLRPSTSVHDDDSPEEQ